MPASDLLLELGAEEIPASFVEPALADLARVIVERAKEARLTHGEVRTFGTPRRLAVLVRDVAARSEDVTKEVTGPSVKAAFDAAGKPTRAAEKFAESVGLSVDRLLRVKTPKGEYLAAKLEEKGRPAPELLPAVLHAAVHGINFKKSMRWGDVELSFARPLHWIVALFGEEVIPVVFGDVRSGRTTYGHRFLAPQPIELRRPADYVEALRAAHVIVDPVERRKLVHERVRAGAEKAGGRLLEDEALLDQVTYLVELPNPVVGSFDERHLDLPPEVLIQEMKSHQRYFSVVDEHGKLLPRFVAVSNTPVKDERVSLRGYERVLRARLSDGRFFFDEDRKHSLETRVPKLERVVFQQKLGTYAEKIERFRLLADFIARRSGKADILPILERAATLAKADLVTGMVGEFPELQGVMGREYAKASGEKPEVALAIFEHYLPRNAQDSLPTQDPGALIGIADRLDTIVGIFGIGKGPSAAADPFGLRRATLAIIHIVLHRGYRFSLVAAIDRALELLEPKLADQKRKANEPPVRDQVLEFFRGRLKVMWAEEHRPDVVEAVLSAGFDDLVAAHLRLKALSAIVGQADFAPLAVAFKRVVNIVEKQGRDIGAGAPDPGRFQDDAEKALFEAYTQAKGKVDALVKADDYAGALREITALKPAVDRFFDRVMVMAEDRALRENRVRLLMQIGGLFGRIADFSKIQAEV
ncbi:MAG: glycine--tRNA ligase subunit beta [Myxococcaceae bacterium]|nr:glycine--tRNA ligase subunit beta [Myxococcaceae bacterium]